MDTLLTELEVLYKTSKVQLLAYETQIEGFKAAKEKVSATTLRTERYPSVDDRYDSFLAFRVQHPDY